MNIDIYDDNIDRRCAAMDMQMSNLSVTRDFDRQTNFDKPHEFGTLEIIDTTQPNTSTLKQSESQPSPVFHSRATELKKRVKRQNRNLFLVIFCFIPTCGFCCGQCLPSD